MHNYKILSLRRFSYMLLQFEMESNTVHETKYINNLLHNIWLVFFHTAGPRFQFQHFQLQQLNSLKPSSCHDHPYASFYYKTAVPFSRQEMLIFIAWNLVVFIKLQIQHDLYIIAIHCSGTFVCRCLYANICERKCCREWKIEWQRGRDMCSSDIYCHMIRCGRR